MSEKLVPLETSQFFKASIFDKFSQWSNKFSKLTPLETFHVFNGSISEKK